jgi:hypothetical protein
MCQTGSEWRHVWIFGILLISFTGKILNVDDDVTMNEKNIHNFVGYFHLLQYNLGASAGNNVWKLSFGEGKKQQHRQ